MFIGLVFTYFSMQIVGNTFFVIDGLTGGVATGNPKVVIGFILYGLLSVLVLFIFIRFISSWFVFARNTFLGFVRRVTDPILLPVQRLIPPIGMFDISAMIVLLLIGFLAVDRTECLCKKLIDITEKDGSISFKVCVVPRASKSEIVGEHYRALKVKLAAPPVDGAANAELIKLLAKNFGVVKGGYPDHQR